MSTQNKQINHDFNIGDIVFVIKDNAIIPCVVTSVIGCPIYEERDSIVNLVNKGNTKYNLIKIKKDFDENSKPIFKVSAYEYDKYEYHCSYVYGNVGELLLDLENTIEKF